MSNKITIALVGLALVAGLGAVMLNQPSATLAPAAALEKEKMVVHKSPTCGCCGVYASYLKREGYEVEISNMSDASLAQTKRSLGVPVELESCHTSEVANYVVEGHIPIEAVQKLLTERPAIKGIGMAGMPAGSPGMPGPKVGDLVIYEINLDGTPGAVFATL
jgi:hypothetical protein